MLEYTNTYVRGQKRIEHGPNAVFAPKPDLIITQQYVLYDVSESRDMPEERRGMVSKIVLTDINLRGVGEETDVTDGVLLFVEIRGLDGTTRYNFKPSGIVNAMGWESTTVVCRAGQSLQHPVVLREFEDGMGTVNKNLHFKVWYIDYNQQIRKPALVMGWINIQIHLSKHV